eukprot:3330426-Rhodomonas_salina.2
MTPSGVLWELSHAQNLTRNSCDPASSRWYRHAHAVQTVSTTPYYASVPRRTVLQYHAVLCFSTMPYCASVQRRAAS